MCEIRDPSIKWPHWHTLIFSNEITIDMRYVCPKDVKKMVVQRARLVNWKKWAAKHEYEELKEGTWLEPGLALLRKKVKENWTVSHRTVARKIFLEGGGAQKRLFDIGWSILPDGGRHREAQGSPLFGMARSKAGDPRGFQEMGSKRRRCRRKNGNDEEVSSRTLSVKANGTEDHFRMKKWVSEKHKCWCMSC